MGVAIVPGWTRTEILKLTNRKAELEEEIHLLERVRNKKKRNDSPDPNEPTKPDEKTQREVEADLELAVVQADLLLYEEEHSSPSDEVRIEDLKTKFLEAIKTIEEHTGKPYDPNHVDRSNLQTTIK